MATHRRKSVDVDAFQYMAKGQGRTFPAWFTDMDSWSLVSGELKIFTPQMESVVVNSGDWVIRGPSGDLSVCKDAGFSRNFEPIPLAATPTNLTAVRRKCRMKDIYCDPDVKPETFTVYYSEFPPDDHYVIGNDNWWKQITNKEFKEKYQYIY